MLMKLVSFLLFLWVIPSGYAGPIEIFGGIRQKVQELQKNLVNEELTLATLTRPENCPLEGPTFREIADKLAAVSSSLSDSKCYEKHAAVIREINRASRAQADAFFEFSPGENGAFVESESKTNINITNNQYQSVQNNNSLVSGLFEISKDKECVESLRKSGNLSAIAQTLSRFGTIGLVLPSSVGMLGSTAILAAAGSLYVLDRLIRPTFSWEYAKDRSDFMALTCSFYNLRTQLHEADFFDSGPENFKELLVKAELYLSHIAKLESENEGAYHFWNDSHQKELESFLKSKFIEEDNAKKIRIYLDLDHAIAFLKSKPGYGRTSSDRFTVRNYFLNSFGKYRALMPVINCAPEFCEKILADLHGFTELSETKILELSTRQWMARTTSFQNFFEELIKKSFPEITAVVADFNERFDFSKELPNGKVYQGISLEYFDLRNRIAKMRRDLSIKVSNLERQQKQRSLSSFDEGAQSEYDIRKEYTKITDLILGEKGWNFVQFLIEDADKSIKKFKWDLEQWRKAKDRPSYRKWACRDAHEMANLWGTANDAVELAYGFLAANNDLWTTYHPHFQTVLKFPYRHSYYHKLFKSVVSAELAKSYLELPEKDKNQTQLEKIARLSSTAKLKWGKTIVGVRRFNLGQTIVEVKEQKESRQELREFQKKYCGMINEL